MKKKFKNNPLIINGYSLFLSSKGFFNFQPLLLTRQFFWFFQQLKQLKLQDKNTQFKTIKYQACLFDNLSYTPIEPVYFLQDTWAARKIFELKPTYHYDVGSSAKTIGILSQFTPITMIDIRPLPLNVSGLNFIQGSILNLPFADNSIDSISSLCVVEHIGLGRYGDSIDSFGSEKAISELKRVVKVGGVIIFSVPVDSINTVYFNAHRAFTREYILSFFDNFELLEEKYQYGYELSETYAPNRGFGTGLFLFKKLKN